MRFSKKILETFIDLPADYIDLMEDVGLEVKSVDGDVLNLELLANRGDHYCYRGIVREIIGRTGQKEKNIGVARLPLFDGATDPNNMFTNEPTKEPYPVKGYLDNDEYKKYTGVDYLFDIETDACASYSLLPLMQKIKNKDRQTTDDYIKTMLPASGVNLILDIIDVTNVVMLERGQPAHVYDADKIVGKIKIRKTKPGETAALLFHEGLTELPTDTMVVSDDEKILCVAGVIGCRAAEVDENTTNILVETALFNPVTVRKAAKQLGVSSIASQIFERGADWFGPENGATRAKKLYSDIGWEQSGPYQLIARRYRGGLIEMSGDYVRQQLEIDISDAEIEERLARYGFIKTDEGYRVPSWRIWDIKWTQADLIEELCRSIGYNALPSKLPPVELGAGLTAAELRRREIDSYLINNGFYEVLTDGLYSPKHAAASPNLEHIGLENSIDGGYAYLRNNTIVQATELVSKNLNVKNRDIRCYEWGKVFQKSGEHNVLWGVMNGAQTGALDVKGLIENLLSGLNLDFEFMPFDLSSQKLHPKRSAIVKINNEPICVLGEIHPNLLSEFDIKNDTPVYFEIDADALLNAVKTKTKYKSPPTIIPSTRDVSIAVPYGKYAGDVADAIHKKFKQISDIKITDVFDKPKESLRNVTYTLTFTGEHSAEELNKLLLEIIKE